MYRILIFSFAYYPKVGGAEVAVKETTDRIGDIAFDMITYRFSKKDKEFEKMGNINLYRINSHSKYLFPFFAYKKAVLLHNNNVYDLIWSVMANYAGFAALFFKLKFKKIPFVLTLQEGDPISYIKKRVFFIYPIFKMIFKKADKVTAISNYLSLFGKNMGHKRRISIIPNGVDTNVFSQEVKWPRTGNKGKRLFTAGRLVKKNGTDILIKSLLRLPEDINLTIAGDGPDKDSLNWLCSKLNLKDRVEFVGYKSHKDLSICMNNSDIFIRPSRSEGLGNVFLEAMGLGVPVIATPVGGIPDFLEDGETGFFCEIENSDSISNKVLYILDEKNKDIIRSILLTAHKMVHDKYEWGRISDNMKDLFYEEIKNVRGK